MTAPRPEVLKVLADRPDPILIERAASILRAGGLVAFPTETVYGLGANALDATAVASIFIAKGRPSNNPVIVHVADAEAARQLVADWPPTAERLAARFWPGPLTLVLPRGPAIPNEVTAGGPTVAVRVPNHPVALALLRAAAVPVAAPSANRSTELSPTRAEHVVRGLGDRIDMVLDGGPTQVGLESTVLDLSRTPPRLLRPGMVTPSAIEAIIGPIERQPPTASESGPLPSPGMMARHYAPRAPLICPPFEKFEQTMELVFQMVHNGHRVGWATFSHMSFGDNRPPENPLIRFVSMSAPEHYASILYKLLHELDEAGCDRIVVDLPPDTEEWQAVRDRLLRAATV
jgi:L-threonylcarbamoyladenylate synthase